MKKQASALAVACFRGLGEHQSAILSRWYCAKMGQELPKELGGEGVRLLIESAAEGFNRPMERLRRDDLRFLRGRALEAARVVLEAGGARVLVPVYLSLSEIAGRDQ